VKNKKHKEIVLLFGKNVRRLRLMRNKTQEELAEDLGISQVQIARIETGVINTSIVNFFLICEVLDVSPTEFFKK
jgi:transcriptional regulator with XRE-family HTH domain